MIDVSIDPSELEARASSVPVSDSPEWMKAWELGLQLSQQQHAKAKDDYDALQAPSTHAMVPRDGFMVPLIGVPPSAVEEKCDRCGKTLHLGKSTFTGSQVLCDKCAACSDHRTGV